MNRSAIVIAALALTGCGLEGIDPPVTNACTSDIDCGGYDCDAERGICVAQAAEGYDVVLEVTPNAEAASAPPTLRTQPVSLTAAREWSIGFEAFVEVRGLVRWGEKRVPAEVIFTRPGLEGRPHQRVRAQTFTEPRVGDGGEYDFVVRLPAGTEFDVEVRPSAMEVEGTDIAWLSILPPQYIEDQFETPPAPPGAAGPIIFRAAFPYAEGLDLPCGRERSTACTLSGTVVAMEDDLVRPQEGLQVRAVDEDGRVVSSAAFTDAEGAFSIVVAPEAESEVGYLLRVSASSDRPLFPTILVDPAFLTEEVRIRVPVTRAVTYAGRVEQPNGNESPAAGATLTFRSGSVVDEAAGIAGRFETTVTSDEDGVFEVELLAGTYEVVVTPLGSDLSVLVEEELTIAPLEGVDRIMGQLFSLRRTTELGITVVDFLGRELPEVTADASALATALEEQPASEHNRSQMATADETGRIALPLDVGAYDLTFRGSARAGFARKVMPGFEVLMRGGTLTDRVTLGAPVPVFGVVTGPDGAPLIDAEVRAFARTESGRYVEIGSARTDEEGAYDLLLPSEL